MPGRVALEIDCDGHGGDVAGSDLDLDGQGSRAAAHGHRTDAGRVDKLEEVALEFGDDGIGTAVGERTEQGFLREEGALLEGAAETDAYDDWRARRSAGLLDGLSHKPHDRLAPIGRGHHLQATHVLRTRALGGNRDPQRVTGEGVNVDDWWRVVACVDAVEGAMDNGLPKMAFLIAFSDALSDGISEVAAGDANVFAHLDEDDGEAGILTHGDTILLGDARVVEETRKDVASELGLLPLASRFERGDYVGRKYSAGADAEIGDLGRNVGGWDFLHARSSPRPVVAARSDNTSRCTHGGVPDSSLPSILEIIEGGVKEARFDGQ
jgi:hypothetical protein